MISFVTFVISKVEGPVIPGAFDERNKNGFKLQVVAYESLVSLLFAAPVSGHTCQGLPASPLETSDLFSILRSVSILSLLPQIASLIMCVIGGNNMFHVGGFLQNGEVDDEGG